MLDEQQAQNAIQKIREETQKQQLQKADQFFGTLAELQKSGNSKIAAIGKAAAIALRRAEVALRSTAFQVLTTTEALAAIEALVRRTIEIVAAKA